MTAIVLLLAMIPGTICIAIAGYLVIHGIGGWGWFLMVGLLLGGFRYTTNEKN